MQRRFISLTASLFVLLAFNSHVFAETRYVNSSNSAPLSPYTNWVDAATNIQQAVDVAVDGDTVLVTNGVYFVSAPIVVTNGILLKGVRGADVTIVDGQTSSPCFYMSNSYAVLDGFTVTRGLSLVGGGGIHCEEGKIWNCTVVSNTAVFYLYQHGSGGLVGGGVYAGDGVEITNCVVSDNKTEVRFSNNPIWSNGGPAYGGGIYCANRCTISGCHVERNVAKGDDGQICALFDTRKIKL